jgi:hypothetical protein
MTSDYFERMNFFTGFFTTAEDWKKAQEYHLAKRRLRNTYFYTPGVVSGCGGRLRVTAGSGGKSVDVAPGYAIDGQGRDLFMPETKTLQLHFDEYHEDMVYVVIKYAERTVDERPNPERPEYKGFAFIREEPDIEIWTTEPNNRHAIELARIKIRANARRIRADDIDDSHVKLADVRLEGFDFETNGKQLQVTQGRVSEVKLDEVSSEGPQPLYLVSAYPTEDKEAVISWYLGSTRMNKRITYTLFLKNHSDQPVKVSYRVLKISR